MDPINRDLLRIIGELCVAIRNIDLKQARCVHYEGKKNPQYVQQKYMAEVELIRMIKLAGF